MNAVAGILLIVLFLLGIVFIYDGYIKDKDLAPKDMDQYHVITILDEPFYDSYSGGYLVRVSTEENATETYQISNSLFKDKWKPEDRKEQLQINHTYYVKTWGTRNSYYRTYKNIINSTELTDPAVTARFIYETRKADEESRKQWERLSSSSKNQSNANKGGLY